MASGSAVRPRVLNRMARAVDAASALEADSPARQWGGRQNPATAEHAAIGRLAGSGSKSAQRRRMARFGEPNTGGRSSVGGAPRSEGFVASATVERAENRRPESMRISPPVVHDRPSNPGYNSPRQSSPSYSAPRQSPSYSAPRQSAPSYSAPRSGGGGGGGGRSSGGGGGIPAGVITGRI